MIRHQAFYLRSRGRTEYIITFKLFQVPWSSKSNLILRGGSLSTELHLSVPARLLTS